MNEWNQTSSWMKFLFIKHIKFTQTHKFPSKMVNFLTKLDFASTYINGKQPALPPATLLKT